MKKNKYIIKEYTIAENNAQQCILMANCKGGRQFAIKWFDNLDYDSANAFANKLEKLFPLPCDTEQIANYMLNTPGLHSKSDKVKINDLIGYGYPADYLKTLTSSELTGLIAKALRGDEKQLIDTTKLRMFPTEDGCEFGKFLDNGEFVSLLGFVDAGNGAQLWVKAPYTFSAEETALILNSIV